MFGCESVRSENVKRLAKKVLEATAADDVKGNIFETFSSNLMTKIATATSVPSTVKTWKTKREKMWTAFHCLRVKDLPPLWDALFKDLSCPISEADEVALLTQHINEKLFERIVSQQATVEPSEVEVPPLTENEANALRYAAGYVPFALKQKPSKRPEFTNFLSTLAVAGEESDYIAYTRRWVNLVDRGGLFRVNDQLYTFFAEVEMIVRRHLARMLSFAAVGHENVMQRQEIVDDVLSHPDVQFSWTLVCTDLADEDLEAELMKHMVELWLTIRGFSAVGSWMEYYKQCKKEGTKRAHALRRGLKRKALDMQSTSTSKEDDNEK